MTITVDAGRVMLVVKEETETDTGIRLAPLGRLTEELLVTRLVVDDEPGAMLLN